MCVCSKYTTDDPVKKASATHSFSTFCCKMFCLSSLKWKFFIKTQHFRILQVLTIIREVEGEHVEWWLLSMRDTYKPDEVQSVNCPDFFCVGVIHR